jgi:hypothetical protein
MLLSCKDKRKVDTTENEPKVSPQNKRFKKERCFVGLGGGENLRFDMCARAHKVSRVESRETI